MEKQTVTEVRPNPSQAQNIIFSIRGNNGIFGRPPQPLPPEEVNAYLGDVSSGKIGNKNYEVLLGSMIRREHQHDPDVLYKEMNNSIANTPDDIKRMGKILAYFTKGDMSARDTLQTDDMLQFLLSSEGKNVIRFEESLQIFLDTLEKVNDNKKRNEYEKAAQKFGKIVFGKQWEYLQQIRLLEAKKLTEDTGEKPLSTTPVEPENIHPEEIVPQELEGLEAILVGESIGGNAGPNAAGVNGYYKDGRFHFWTADYPGDKIGNSPRVIFRLASIPLRDYRRIADQGEIGPPFLINGVYPDNPKDPEFNKLCVRSALQHNAAKIHDFLKKGGKVSALPQTPLLPNLAGLQKQLVPVGV